MTHMTIVLAGGSGFIGTKLTEALIAIGHTVIVIDMRSPRFTDKNLFFIQCDLSAQPLPYNILEKTDAVINLVGAPISNKWTPSYKKIIQDSRIRSTRTLVEALCAAQSRPTTFINASAIGYYGDTEELVVDEQGSKGVGFLSDVVSAWEQEAIKAESAGVRTVLVRTAPVLGQGGMLASLMKTVRFGFLMRLSKKDFWMSWIHEDDIVGVYLFALQTATLQGVVNAVAPDHIRHHTFIDMLGKAVHRRVLGTVPSFVGKRLFGELLDELTKSQQVQPRRLTDKGFTFAHPTVSSAFHAIFLKKK